MVSRSIGISLVIAAGMPCGNEGPMVHIGAIIGANIHRLKCGKNTITEEIRNSKIEHEFI